MKDDSPLAAIGPVTRQRVVEAVAERIRAEVLAGRIPAGSRLPAERELAVSLGVNRLTLRAALARLEATGLVSTRHGSGTVVASWRERVGLEALPMVLRSLEEGEPAWVELLVSFLEVRRVLAAEAVALAAVRHTPDDIERLRAIAEAQKLHVHDAIAYAKGDLEFQRAVIRATRNAGFDLLLNSFARFFEELPAVVARLYERRVEALGFYEGVIALLKRRDAAASRAVVLATLTTLDAEWLRRQNYKVDAKPQPKRKARTR
jgi:GntR family transcriptional repressor for pyruvate dehydrogenase complex